MYALFAYIYKIQIHKTLKISTLQNELGFSLVPSCSLYFKLHFLRFSTVHFLIPIHQILQESF
jgi:hypothetical protein